MGQRPLLLGVALGRQVDVRGAAGFAREQRDVERELRGAERALPALGIVEVADRVDVGEDHGVEITGLERSADLVRGAARLGRGVAGAGLFGAADLAEAAAVRRRGDLIEAGAVSAVEAEDVGEAEQRLGDLLAIGAAEDPLAPDDHDRAVVAERVGEPGGVVVGVAALLVLVLACRAAGVASDPRKVSRTSAGARG